MLYNIDGNLFDFLGIGEASTWLSGNQVAQVEQYEPGYLFVVDPSTKANAPHLYADAFPIIVLEDVHPGAAVVLVVYNDEPWVMNYNTFFKRNPQPFWET